MSVPLPEDMDRLTGWDRTTLDLVEMQGLALVGVTCADCHRVRRPGEFWTNRRTGEHHCAAWHECEQAIKRHNAIVAEMAALGTGGGE